MSTIYTATSIAWSLLSTVSHLHLYIYIEIWIFNIFHYHSLKISGFKKNNKKQKQQIRVDSSESYKVHTQAWK